LYQPVSAPSPNNGLRKTRYFHGQRWGVREGLKHVGDGTALLEQQIADLAGFVQNLVPAEHGDTRPSRFH